MFRAPSTCSRRPLRRHALPALKGLVALAALLLPPGHSVLAQESSAGDYFAPELPPDRVGVSFEFDPDHGWVERRRIFWADPIQQANTPTTRVYVDSFCGVDERMSSNSLDLSASGKIGLVDVATHIAIDSFNSKRDLTSSFVFGFERINARSMVHYSDVPATQWDPKVLDILSRPEPERTQLWRAYGCGSYIAFGHANRGKLAARISLSESDSFSSRNAFYSLAVSYGPSSGSVQVMQAVATAMSTQGLRVEVFAEGWDTSIPAYQLPSIQELENPANHMALANAMQASAAHAERKHGLYLTRLSAFLPGGMAPNLGTYPYSEGILSGAVDQAMASLKSLVESNRFTRPFTLEQFLDMHPIPGASESCADALQRTRLAVIDGLESLRIAVANYAKGDHCLDPNGQYSSAIDAARNELDSRTDDLNQVLAAIQVVASALPTCTIEVSERYSPGGSTLFDNEVLYDLKITDAAIFWDGTVPGLITQLSRPGTVVFHVDEPGGQTVTRWTGNGTMGWFNIDRVTPKPSGLYDIEFGCVIQQRNDARSVHLLWVDDFNRPFSRDYDVVNDH